MRLFWFRFCVCMRCQMPSLFKHWCPHAGQRQACHLDITLALCAASFSDFVSLSSLMDWCARASNRPRSCDLARRPLAALRSAAAVERWTWFVAGSPCYFKCLRKENEPSLNTFPLYDGVQKQSIVFFQSKATSWLSTFPLYDSAQKQFIVFLQSKATSP